MIYSSLVAWRTLLQWLLLLALLNFTLDAKDLFGRVKKKSDFYELWQKHKQLRIMDISEVWPDVEDKICISSYMDPLTKLNSSCRSTKFKKDVLPLNISQMIRKMVPVSPRTVISCEWKGHPFWDWRKVSGNGDSNRIRSHINKFKRVGLRFTVRDLSRRVNHLSKVIWDRKVTAEFTRSISFTWIDYPVLLVDL